MVHTGDVLDELGDGGVVGQGTSGCLHVRKLGHKLLDLPHSFSIVTLLRNEPKKSSLFKLV